MAPRHLERLECGHRRTRLSTIKRLAAALYSLSPDIWPDGPEFLEKVLIDAIGPALAAESNWAGVQVKKRESRQRRKAEKIALEGHLYEKMEAEIRGRVREEVAEEIERRRQLEGSKWWAKQSALFGDQPDEIKHRRGHGRGPQDRRGVANPPKTAPKGDA
jgi:hypothetical protein